MSSFFNSLRFGSRGGGAGGDMNHVFKGIWIGGYTVLTPHTLQGAGIRHVVNAAEELLDGQLVDWHDLQRSGITVQHVPLDDHVGQPIIPMSSALRAALQMIHSCVESGQNVLVNCAMGISRSPTVVIAYLIVHQGMSFDKAYNIVRRGRPVASPNHGFQQQLMQLADGDGGYGYGSPMHSRVPSSGILFMREEPRPYYSPARTPLTGYAGMRTGGYSTGGYSPGGYYPRPMTAYGGGRMIRQY